jgi:hypothetical protein
LSVAGQVGADEVDSLVRTEMRKQAIPGCNVSGINDERIAHEVARIYVPDLPPYDPRPMIHPVRWDGEGKLISVR